MVFGMFQINAFQGIFRRVPEKSPLDPFKKVFRDFQRSSKAFQDVSRGLNFFLPSFQREFQKNFRYLQDVSGGMKVASIDFRYFLRRF